MTIENIMWPFTRKKTVEEAVPQTLWDATIEHMEGRVRYSTATATILASRKGEGVCFADYGEEYLCKTPQDNYFHLTFQQFGNGRKLYYSLHPITLENAMRYWNRLPTHTCSFKKAFGVDITDA